MDVHNQDRFANIPGLGECVQVSKVEAGIAVGKAKVRTGVMVRHIIFSLFLDTQYFENHFNPHSRAERKAGHAIYHAQASSL